MALLLLINASHHYTSGVTTITAKRKLPFQSLSLSSFQQSTKHGQRLHQHASVGSSTSIAYTRSFGRFAGNSPSLLKDERFPPGGAQMCRTIITSTRPAVFESVRSILLTRKERRIKEDEQIFNLKKRTNEALSVVVGSCTLQNISMIRACLEQWLRINPKNVGSINSMMRARERAVWSTKILCRWVDELALGKNPLVSGPELVQVLHRVLHAWRLLQKQLHQQHQERIMIWILGPKLVHELLSFSKSFVIWQERPRA
jgi:hypothetical protein